MAPWCYSSRSKRRARFLPIIVALRPDPPPSAGACACSAASMIEPTVDDPGSTREVVEPPKNITFPAAPSKAIPGPIRGAGVPDDNDAAPVTTTVRPYRRCILSFAISRRPSDAQTVQIRAGDI
jgi:hypothetical protein